MQHTSIVQIFKVNEPRSGTKDGRAWDIQTAECALLTGDGEVSQVGVLRIPKDLRSKLSRGLFTASFSLRASLKDRTIESVLTDLTPLPARTGKGSADK